MDSIEQVSYIITDIIKMLAAVFLVLLVAVYASNKEFKDDSIKKYWYLPALLMLFSFVKDWIDSDWLYWFKEEKYSRNYMGITTKIHLHYLMQLGLRRKQKVLE